MRISIRAVVRGESECLTLHQIRIMVDNIHEPDPRPALGVILEPAVLIHVRMDGQQDRVGIAVLVYTKSGVIWNFFNPAFIKVKSSK